MNSIWKWKMKLDIVLECKFYSHKQIFTSLLAARQKFGELFCPSRFATRTYNARCTHISMNRCISALISYILFDVACFCPSLSAFQLSQAKIRTCSRQTTKSIWSVSSSSKKNLQKYWKGWELMSVETIIQMLELEESVSRYKLVRRRQRKSENRIGTRMKWTPEIAE